MEKSRGWTRVFPVQKEVKEVSVNRDGNGNSSWKGHNITVVEKESDFCMSLQRVGSFTKELSDKGLSVER